jgi:tetratricopeptide (TPR) repeat protein
VHHGSGHRHHHHVGHVHYHSFYRHSGISLSFVFGSGLYAGVRYYYPYRHFGYGCDYAFFYPRPVCWTYVPFGFYSDYTPVYVERVRYVYPRTEVVVESEDAPEAVGAETVEPQPAAGSPTTEKFLREASELFHDGEYYEAAKQFRLAALSAPDEAGPLFALGQALIAMGSDSYAARVIRRAIAINPGLVHEAGDIVGVYPSREEFDKAVRRLETLAARRAPDSDARFLVAVQRYCSGDPRSRVDFTDLSKLLPGDPVVSVFAEASLTRFGGAESDLPPVEEQPADDE